MVVKSEIKLIKSLQQKKYRTAHQLFVAEGIKTNEVLLQEGFRPHSILSSREGVLPSHTNLIKKISEKELRNLSTLKTPNAVLGVYHFPEINPVDYSDWVLALDQIKDPGNLGTIIRLCDWFGISHLLCSTNTVDCYNPKVLQATMGSIARVNINYCDLQEELVEADMPVYGTFMEGENVAAVSWPTKGILVMGSESHGISPEIEKLISKKVTIKAQGEPAAESLNVAMASAIILQEIRR